jgi:hypothetical protein
VNRYFFLQNKTLNKYYIIPIFRLNETYNFKSEDAECIEKYMSTAESCKNYMYQLKMKFGIIGLRVGKAITSLIECELVSIIVSLSIPIPSPPVGGIAYSNATKKS